MTHVVEWISKKGSPSRTHLSSSGTRGLCGFNPGEQQYQVVRSFQAQNQLKPTTIDCVQCVDVYKRGIREDAGGPILLKSGQTPVPSKKSVAPPPAKKTPVTKQVVRKPKAKKKERIMAKTKDVEARCSVCSKPLSRDASVERGMGETCDGKHKAAKAAGFKSVAAAREAKTVEKLPSDLWIPLKDAIKKAQEKQPGLTIYRFLQLIGGDRMLEKPLRREFEVKYYRNKRYISKRCLDFLPEPEEA